MPESGSYGSVGEPVGNHRLYPEKPNFFMQENIKRDLSSTAIQLIACLIWLSWYMDGLPTISQQKCLPDLMRGPPENVRT